MNLEVETWLKRAKSNLEHAKIPNKDDLIDYGGYIFYEELCFDLQQSVEKALKALMIHNMIKVPKTHNLSDLISRLEEKNINVPENVKLAKLMTTYAVETRYPANEEGVTESEYNEALEIAENVYEWVSKQIT
jgi:HEPN domain-containing protein